VRQAPEAVVIGQEHLAAPDRAVRAVAGAVEGEADHRQAAVQAVFRHDRGDVGVVMLHMQVLQAIGVVRRPAAGQVARMEVADDPLRPRAKDGLEVLDRLLECIERLEVLHVADVLAHEGVIVAREAERGLELAAHGQGGWQAERQFDRKRCIPA